MPAFKPAQPSEDAPFVPWVVLSRDPVGTVIRTASKLRSSMVLHGYSQSEIARAIDSLRDAQVQMTHLLGRHPSR